MTVRKGHIGNNDGVQHMSEILRERPAPDAIDSFYQDVRKFMNFQRTDQTMGVLREKAASRMVLGSGSPAKVASVLCAHNAASTTNAKSRELARIRTTLASPEAPSQVCRLSGQCGSTAKQDVLVAADMDTGAEEEDFVAWVAYQKAKKEERKEQGGDDRGKSGQCQFKDGGWRK